MFGVLKRFLLFAGKRKKLLVKSMIVAFVGAVFSALQVVAMMFSLDYIVAGQISKIWFVFSIMLVSIIGRAACSYYSTNAQTETGYFMVAEKRIHIGDRLRYIPMGFFNKNSIGNITAIVTTTLSGIENTAARCLVLVLGGFLNTLALCLMLVFADWRIALLAIVGVLAYLVVTELSQRAAIKTAPAWQHAQEGLVAAVLEYIQGMSIVKSYGLEKDNGQTVNVAVDSSSQKALSFEYALAPWMAIRQLVVRVFSIGIILSALYLYAGGILPLSRCLLLLIASFMIYQDLESAGNMSDNLQLLGTSIDQANTIDSTPVMDIDGKELEPEESSISFQNVGFSYGPRKILDNINLSIPGGTTTAIIGPSGGGKTTLCNLIARFWDVETGSISIGGYNVKDYKLDSLMKNISMVFQNVYLFQDTIENNIKFGRPLCFQRGCNQSCKRRLLS